MANVSSSSPMLGDDGNSAIIYIYDLMADGSLPNVHTASTGPSNDDTWMELDYVQNQGINEQDDTQGVGVLTQKAQIQLAGTTTNTCNIQVVMNEDQWFGQAVDASATPPIRAGSLRNLGLAKTRRAGTEKGFRMFYTGDETAGDWYSEFKGTITNTNPSISDSAQYWTTPFTIAINGAVTDHQLA